MRDRLVKLVKASLTRHIGKSCKLAENIVDDLLKDGVVVPPVKVGDVVWVVDYVLDTLCVFEYKVSETMLFHLMFHEDEYFGWGKTVFATKKEAKRALAEREKYD